jgi:hypothetical protein
MDGMPGPGAAARPSEPGSGMIGRVCAALTFAARAHANQRRKGAAQEPYINHLIEVADLVRGATGGTDEDALVAALLHDVVEDTAVTLGELAERFGEEVARVVVENSRRHVPAQGRTPPRPHRRGSAQVAPRTAREGGRPDIEPARGGEVAARGMGF